MAKYLDETGLAHFWGNAKSEFQGLEKGLNIVAIESDGTGDATLVYDSDMTSALIDSLLDSDVSHVASALQSAGIEALDFCIVSHYHSDHVGGFISGSLDSYITSDTIFILPEVPLSAAGTTVISNYNAIQTLISNKGCSSIVPTEEGQTIAFGSSSEMSFHNVAHEQYYEMPTFDYNNCSLCCKFTYKNESALFLSGDIAYYAQEFLVGKVGHVNIYKAQHHGSDQFISDAFMNELSPDFIYVCCSTDNVDVWYGRRYFLFTCNKYGYPVAATGENGTFSMFLSQRGHLETSAVTASNGGFIHSAATLLGDQTYNQPHTDLTLAQLCEYIKTYTNTSFIITRALFTQLYSDLALGSTNLSFKIDIEKRSASVWYGNVSIANTGETIRHIEYINGNVAVYGVPRKMYIDTGNLVNGETAPLDNSNNRNLYGATIDTENNTVKGLTGYNSIHGIVNVSNATGSTININVFGQTFLLPVIAGVTTQQVTFYLPRVAFSGSTAYTIKNNSNDTVRIRLEVDFVDVA